VLFRSTGVVVEFVAGELTEFEKSRARIEQGLEAVPGQKLTAFHMSRPTAFVTTEGQRRHLLAQGGVGGSMLYGIGLDGRIIGSQ
jgi:hypothetical protein